MIRNNFKEIPLNSSNHLINHGPLVLVSTRNSKGKYNIAPVAWQSPVSKDPPLILIVLADTHRTTSNILQTKEYILCIPHLSMLSIILKTGSISGKKVDKFAKYKIPTIHGENVDSLVPEESIGYIECKLYKKVKVHESYIIIGKTIAAFAKENIFNKRLLIEKKEGKTLHHLGGAFFSIPGDRIETE